MFGGMPPQAVSPNRLGLGSADTDLSSYWPSGGSLREASVAINDAVEVPTGEAFCCCVNFVSCWSTDAVEAC